MDEIKLPELPEVLLPGIVAVQSSDLKVLVDAYNTAVRVINTQQTTISQLATELQSCREDISKIAKILEELYEA